MGSAKKVPVGLIQNFEKELPRRFYFYRIGTVKKCLVASGSQDESAANPEAKVHLVIYNTARGTKKCPTGTS